MSYNIDHVETLVLDAWMSAADILMLAKKHKKDLPEANFISGHADAAQKAIEEGHPTRQIQLKNFWWYGSWSGNSYHEGVLQKIAPHVTGRVDAVLTWEGGDTTSALRIVDGVFIEVELVQMIVAPTKKGVDNLDTPVGIRKAMLKVSKAPREPGKHEGNSFQEGWTAALFEFANRLPKG